MQDGTLRLRIGKLTDSHAHITVYDHGGHSGAIILSRSTWNAIEETGDIVAGEGDYIDVELTITGQVEGIGEGESRRSIAKGRGDD